MAFDYKKEYKEFYMPPKHPGIAQIPAMTFLLSGEKATLTKKRANIKRPWSFFTEWRTQSR